MRKTYLKTTILLVLTVFTASCKHEVDLFADYREVPIIYGLLDATADTNFVKITHIFYPNGDINQAALNPATSNYPGRLDVRLTEYRNGEPTREIILDTITIHNKQTGTFYAPAQKLYYTTEALNLNTSGDKYSYELSVALPDSTIYAKADIVGNRNFKVKSLAVNFSKEYFHTKRPINFYPATNGDYYQAEMSFTFYERLTPDSDSVPRTFSWKVSENDDYYLSHHMDEDTYVLSYRPAAFWMALCEYLGNDTLNESVVRLIGDYPVEIMISACGKNLKQYMYFNNSTSIAPGDPEFSLIDGGYGVFSSRMTIRRKVRLAGETVPELVGNKYYHFKFMGGKSDESAQP